MISAITAVMNREKHLEKMLPSWTKVTQVKDFVIVDWSSEKPVIENKIIQEQINTFNNIKIIRVENQKYFYRCLAWNLAFQNTNIENNILLKLDVDYFNLNADWIYDLALESNKYLDGYFITGAWKFYEGSTGFLLVNKKDFDKGYNENLLPIYGGEDQDLILRLSKRKINTDNNLYKEWIGLKHIIFFNIRKYLYHIPHTDFDRVVHLKNFQDVLKNGEIDSPKITESAIKNWEIIKKFPEWEPKKYEILEESKSYIRVKIID